MNVLNPMNAALQANEIWRMTPDTITGASVEAALATAYARLKDGQAGMYRIVPTNSNAYYFIVYRMDAAYGGANGWLYGKMYCYRLFDGVWTKVTDIVGDQPLTGPEIMDDDGAERPAESITE